MNKTLLRFFIKSNWAIWLGFLLFTLFEVLVMVAMYDLMRAPEMQEFMNIQATDILTMVATSLPIMAAIFTTAYTVFIVFRLVYRPVDSTSIGAHLSAGIKRSTYIITAIFFLVASLVLMYTIIFVVCGLAMIAWEPISWLNWLNTVCLVLLACITVASLSFLFASVFGSRGIGKIGMFGIPALFALLQMLSMFVDLYLENFKIGYLTPHGWIDAEAAAVGAFDLWWLAIIGFVTISCALFTISLVLFRKRQLSI